MDRRRRHALVAVRLFSASPGAAAAMIGRARDGVDRWERERLCILDARFAQTHFIDDAESGRARGARAEDEKWLRARRAGRKTR